MFKKPLIRQGRRLQEQVRDYSGFTISSKACLNLSSKKWRKPNRFLVISLIPIWS